MTERTRGNKATYLIGLRGCSINYDFYESIAACLAVVQFALAFIGSILSRNILFLARMGFRCSLLIFYDAWRALTVINLVFSLQRSGGGEIERGIGYLLKSSNEFVRN